MKKGDVVWACSKPTGRQHDKPRPEQVMIKSVGAHEVRVSDRVESLAFGLRVPPWRLFPSREAAIAAWAAQAREMAEELWRTAAALREAARKAEES